VTTRAQIIEDVRECLERSDERDEEVVDILITLGYIDSVAIRMNSRPEEDQ